jgi:hypothetical protein
MVRTKQTTRMCTGQPAYLRIFRAAQLLASTPPNTPPVKSMKDRVRHAMKKKRHNIIQNKEIRKVLHFQHRTELILRKLDMKSVHASKEVDANIRTTAEYTLEAFKVIIHHTYHHQRLIHSYIVTYVVTAGGTRSSVRGKQKKMCLTPCKM